MAKTQNVETAKKKKLIVWLKIRSYINEEGQPIERLNKGIYALDKIPARLKNQPITVMEIFDSEIPARTLMQMANWCGIMHPEDYSDDELLAKMVSTPKLN